MIDSASERAEDDTSGSVSSAEQPRMEPSAIEASPADPDKPSTVDLALILPVVIADAYNPQSQTQGDITFRGNFVLQPLGEIGPDITFELVPGTILQASATGTVRVAVNATTAADTGIVTYDDWEIHLVPDAAPDWWIEYDHVVGMLVEDGQWVEAGTPLARAAPASLRHGGSWGQKNVDEFEWGLRAPSPAGSGTTAPVGPCPIPFLSENDRQRLNGILDTMRQLGWPSLASVCLVDKAPG